MYLLCHHFLLALQHLVHRSLTLSMSIPPLSLPPAGLNPCEHGGVCVNTAGSFQCQCQRGYGGTRCHSDINECQSQPCQHQGTCMDKTGGYLCICEPDPPLSDPRSLWLWVAIGMAATLGLAVAAIVIGVKVIAPRRRGGELPVVRSQHRQGGAVHDRDHQGAAWNSSSSTGLTRSKKQSGKKQGKNSGRKRREPLGEDAIGLR
ncbi:UNVERIFIED_CONTAM: hypothetical protein FKN15_069708 [Acipenser sinensis]